LFESSGSSPERTLCNLEKTLLENNFYINLF